ncbi:MAG: hypothetical protein ACR2J8_10440 [Thermomicrobiales bacterium]
MLHPLAPARRAPLPLFDVVGRLALLATCWFAMTVAPVSAQEVGSCADFPSRDDAQWQLEQDPSDPLGLDPDGNGVACEDAFGQPAPQQPEQTQGNGCERVTAPASERGSDAWTPLELGYLEAAGPLFVDLAGAHDQAVTLTSSRDPENADWITSIENQTAIFVSVYSALACIEPPGAFADAHYAFEDAAASYANATQLFTTAAWSADMAGMDRAESDLAVAAQTFENACWLLYAVSEDRGIPLETAA